MISLPNLGTQRQLSIEEETKATEFANDNLLKIVPESDGSVKNVSKSNCTSNDLRASLTRPAELIEDV